MSADNKSKMHHQEIRKRRVLMTVGSYLMTFIGALVCSINGLLEPKYLAHFLIATALINGCFYIAFHFGWNLKFKDPNLTPWQMSLSLIPPLYTLIFIESSQARSAMMFVAIVPLLYGILDLDTKRFLKVAGINIAGYLLTILIIMQVRPEFVDWTSEAVQTTTMIIVVIQTALIGGFISNLRANLKRKNQELNSAMDRIQVLLNIDELTGVSNRRFLFETLERESSRCSRGSRPFSVCIIDVDHFKNINDTYGHLIGDKVLKTIASEMKNTSRSSDCFGRYGGEEFMLIMPETGISGAIAKAEKLREMVSSENLETLPDNKPVTISAGVAEFHSGESIKELLSRADEALYRAKESGRNQVQQ